MVGTLRKVLQITLDEYCFDLIQDCVNMMFIAYSILFRCFGGCGTSWVSNNNVEIELGGPTLVNLAKFPGTWEILERSFQDHAKIGFTMYS